MRRRSRTAAALAALLAVVGVGACRRGPPQPSVASIRLVEGGAAPQLGEAGLAPADVEGLARKALEGAGFRVEAGRARAFDARVELLSLRLLTDPNGGTWCESSVALELDPLQRGPGRAALTEAGQGAAPVTSSPEQAWRAAVEEATRAAVAQLAIAVAAEEKRIPELLADVDAADPRVRERAIIALGERRSVEAVPALLARLGDPEQRVVDRVVGALAQIRDPRAVGPLIDLSRRRSPREQARFARLIGDIGGSEARGYLQTLAAGASEPAVRRAAAEALEELSAAEVARPRATGR